MKIFIYKTLFIFVCIFVIFQLTLGAKINQLNNKYILLIDNIVTTGATLEACAQTLLEVPGEKVSVATITIA